MKKAKVYSRLIWLGVLSAIYALAGIIVELAQPEFAEVIAPVLPEGAAKYWILATAIATIILRTRTNQAVK